MRYLFLTITLIGTMASYAGDGIYAVKGIPEALLKDADVVKRMEDIRFEIVSLSETILHKKYALTILNENGDRKADFVDYYDQLRQIKSIDGTLYDAAGNVVKRVKGKDIQDLSGVDNNSLMDDSRLKVHSFSYKVYPYTVEYEEEVKFNNSYMLPQWMPQASEHLSVEKSSFAVVVPDNYTLRYKTFNYKEAPAVSTEKNKKIMSWQIAAVPAVIRQYAAPRWNELTPCLFLAPSEFQMEGYKGNGNSWEGLGKFQLALNVGRDVLPDNIQQTVKQLTGNLTDEKEKVKVLYQYLQQNTRYISIQLGISGLQPFPADFVAKKGYGDCKALSNYMCSLLKAAGIKSYYTWVHAGDSKEDKYLIEDFPSDQFNHIIVCVPLQRDTIWLECTSQSTPAGYMGNFTGNRKALLIDENGGKLIATPRYGLKENLQLRTIKGTVDGEGNFTAKVKTAYTGIQQDNVQGMINAVSKDKLKEILNEELNLATYDIKDFKYEERKDLLPQVDEELDLTVSKFATISGKRLFIAPNLLNKSSTRLSEETGRTYDFVFDLAYRDVDSVEINIAPGYTSEALPKEVSLQTKFGKYSNTVKVANNKILCTRIREQYAGRFPAKDYEALAQYYQAIYDADRSRVVLVKN